MNSPDMVSDFRLIVDTDLSRGIVRLRLCDRHGRQQAAHQVELSRLDRDLWNGLLDVRAYVARHRKRANSDADDSLLARLGVFLGQQVLGSRITNVLVASNARRTMQVELPDTSNNALAATLARVPWSIARVSGSTDDFLDLNLVVTVTTRGLPARDPFVAEVARRVSNGQTPLRVLLVHADATRSSALAWRREREHLKRFFADRIMRRRDVQFDFLDHGVTRSLLREHISRANGYHILHWSGHGKRDRMELLGENGLGEEITGQELVEMFRTAGGFIPQLVYLAACHSASLVDIHTPQRVREHPGQNPLPPPKRPWDANIAGTVAGYSGTAMALLRASVPQVVAMRYQVADEFSRELAAAFYHRLLADNEPRSVGQALHLARRQVATDGPESARRVAGDRANPLALGHPGAFLAPRARRSRQLHRLRPVPQPLLPGDDDRLKPPRRFVGRTRELTRLHRQWLAGTSDRAVASIRGPRHMGKTSLAAEVINVWHQRFEYVLAFGLGEKPLDIDAFHRRCHEQLLVACQGYRKLCADDPCRAVFVPRTRSTDGDDPILRMRVNFIEVLRDWSVLIVIDAFESNLETIANDSAGHRCQDPSWHLLLTELAAVLPETASRMLLTTSAPLSVLANHAQVLGIELRPLHRNESKLFLRTNEHVARLIRGDDAERELVKRLLEVADGRPYVLARLCELAADPAALSGELTRATEGLHSLARTLPSTQSRLLVTSSALPAAFADEQGVLHISNAPIPASENPARTVHRRFEPEREPEHGLQESSDARQPNASFDHPAWSAMQLHARPTGQHACPDTTVVVAGDISVVVYNEAVGLHWTLHIAPATTMSELAALFRQETRERPWPSHDVKAPSPYHRILFFRSSDARAQPLPGSTAMHELLGAETTTTLNVGWKLVIRD